MLTAANDDEQTWQAWAGGVDCFLPKPFDPDLLLRWVSYMSAHSRAQIGSLTAERWRPPRGRDPALAARASRGAALSPLRCEPRSHRVCRQDSHFEPGDEESLWPRERPDWRLRERQCPW